MALLFPSLVCFFGVRFLVTVGSDSFKCVSSGRVNPLSHCGSRWSQADCQH